MWHRMTDATTSIHCIWYVMVHRWPCAGSVIALGHALALLTAWGVQHLLALLRLARILHALVQCLGAA